MTPNTRSSSTGITFVLTSCGRFDLLHETLTSFFRFNTAPMARYLIIEDSTDQAVRDVVSQFDFPIEVMLNPTRIGQMASIDRAYATVDTPYIFHCEDDWRFFRSGFVEDSLVILQEDASVSVVNCRRLSQRKDMAPLLETPLFSARGVNYRKDVRVWSDWCGYTFNPGLRRTANYRSLGSFKLYGHERELSVVFKRMGKVIGYLADPACETTGMDRRLTKPDVAPWRQV